MQIKTLYDVGDRVLIDSDKSLIAVITGIRILNTQGSIEYQLGWINAGSCHQAWIDEWRITPWVE